MTADCQKNIIDFDDDDVMSKKQALLSIDHTNQLRTRFVQRQKGFGEFYRNVHIKNWS